MARPKPDRKEFTQRAGLVITIAAVVTVTILLLWHAASVLLLLFAGVLWAIVLRSAADLLVRVTPLSPGWSVVLMMLLFAAAGGAILWFYGPQIAQGIHDLVYGFPNVMASIASYLEQFEWGRGLVAIVRGIEWDSVAPDLVKRLMGVFATALPAIGGLLVVLFLGLYLAAEPHTYINGTLRLVPIHQRRRAAEVLQRLGYVLKWLLVGRALSMAVLFALTWIGLALLGVPHALSLALLAGLLEFIPNIGPILAAVPAVIVGFSQSPALALAVVALYVALQTFESYVLTPLIQREMIAIPPALLFTVQLVMGLFFGVLGCHWPKR